MNRLSTNETARRLGVKPATVYAYVSRGLLHPKRGADDRSSTFDPTEVEQLAARGRAATSSQAGARPLAIASALTLIEDGRFWYRGEDALHLAQERSFEEVATWLWSGSFEVGLPWTSPSAVVVPAIEAQEGFGRAETVLPVDRIRLIVAIASALDPLRYDLGPEAVVDRARRLIATMVEALPRRGQQRGIEMSIAERLWPRLTSEPPDPSKLHALNAALVLLADHELPASTVAVRLAASTGAHLYAVVSAGLGVIDGPKHGGASLAAEALLAEVAVKDGGAQAVVSERLRRGERIPGFGQPLYPDGDPRAGLLLELTEAAVGEEALRHARDVISVMEDAGRPQRNIDFALAAFARATGMQRGAGELLFSVARTAGWIAHALEEYAAGTWYRARARYVGPRPRPMPGR